MVAALVFRAFHVSPLVSPTTAAMAITFTHASAAPTSPCYFAWPCSLSKVASEEPTLFLRLFLLGFQLNYVLFVCEFLFCLHFGMEVGCGEG